MDFSCNTDLTNYINYITPGQLTTGVGVFGGIAIIVGIIIFLLSITALILSIIAFVDIVNSPGLSVAKSSGAYGFALTTMILLIFIVIAGSFNGNY